MKGVLNTTKFHRQLGLVDPQRLYDLRVAIVGAGAIGSMVGIALAKMGVGTIELYDDDMVEEHNLPNQFYRLQDIGKPKVEALARTLVEDFGAFEAIPHMMRIDPKKFEVDSETNIVVCAVDDMDFRKEFWGKCIQMKFAPGLYIETRMGGEDFRVYTLVPNDSENHQRYKESLYSNEDASDDPCTERSILYNVMLIASLVANQIKKFVTDDELLFELIGDLRNVMIMTSRELKEAESDVERSLDRDIEEIDLLEEDLGEGSEGADDDF
jgi:molybdopterin/thiamine biosynthesis adenylyltransferase